MSIPPCIGLNGGLIFPHTEAFSSQIATDTQEETDRYWNAIVGNGGKESECGITNARSRGFATDPPLRYALRRR